MPVLYFRNPGGVEKLIKFKKGSQLSPALVQIKVSVLQNSDLNCNWRIEYLNTMLYACSFLCYANLTKPLHFPTEDVDWVTASVNSHDICLALRKISFFL